MFRSFVARVGALLAVVLFLAGHGHAQVTVDARLAPGQPPLIAAFRSIAEGLPESSLAGIRHGLDRGVDLIEVQVQITADGVHVVFHDAFLNRMTDVETVFPDGPIGGPSRDARGGRDYLADYTLDEIRQLHLLFEGEPTEHRIPTVEEALDLVGGRRLALLSLQAFDMDGLVSLLEMRATDHILVYSVDPEVLKEVIDVTGLPGFASVRRSRVFDTPDNLAILEDTFDVIGEDLALAHINSTSLLTPELLERAEEMGVHLSVSGTGREDFALGDLGDTGPWRNALDSGAMVFWTTYPDRVLELAGR